MLSVRWIEAKKKQMKKKITVLTLSAMLFALSVPAEATVPTAIKVCLRSRTNENDLKAKFLI